MTLGLLPLLAAFVQIGICVALARDRRGPVVSLNYATFEGASAGGVDIFLGIPYAQPPVRNLRFRRPRPPLPLPGTTPVSDRSISAQSPSYLERTDDFNIVQATTFGNACPQQNYTLPYIPDLDYTALATFFSNANASEDCGCYLPVLESVRYELEVDRTHNTSGLYANVYRPSGVTRQSKLPVVVVSTHPYNAE